MAPVSPTVARWELFERLRRRQTDLGLSGPKIAKQLGYAPNYWYKIERDRMVLPEEKHLALLDMIEVDDEERERLIELRAQAKARGWWDEYAGLFTAQQSRLWGLEYGAEEICSFESLLIPGLLQTEDYARSLIAGDQVIVRRPEVRRRVQTRMKRQERLGGDDPVRLNVVISEAALHQQIGGEDVLRAQLEHLVELITTHDGIEVLVLPYSSLTGAARGGGAFHILDFPGDQVSPLGWHESAVVAEVIEDPMTIETLAATFGSVAQASLSPEESLARIRDIARHVGSSV
ncbi:helix-turn-helix domain-containing protein [Nocardia vermiculata]|uniref:Helix-turn-helix domain-containing protein n=1 Tax=Nocardia vermiculata TaxID=257274 RepID=A0A846Y7Z2_9NOCA|nr:helix-turn-helix transcriptional regulator [Nocardia vermiculata]NKY54515.1 helix-turn-helix domain-containing protein [Nocardia vermiculata]